MKPTRIPVLVAVALVFAAVAFLVVRAFYGDIPRLPRSAPVSLFLLGVAELVTAYAIRNRLQRRPGTKPIEPMSVARAAALAKASSLVGAFSVGVYGGFLAYTLERRDQLAVAGSDAVISGISLGCGLLLTIAALLLERVCRAPRPPDEHRLGSAP